jgi:Raf kinase inhibitor-like YbhB/YbcL family protein
MDPRAHITLADNVNPPFSWDMPPVETQSFALLCHDQDVPAKSDDINQEGKVLDANLARVESFHWVLVDLPPTLREIEEGMFSNGITPRGKAAALAPLGARQGINDYTVWFAADHDMYGDYFGYDGPCPPWNDARVHHYVFTLYALAVPSLNLHGRFTGADALRSMQGHILAQAALTGTYTLNPQLAPIQIGVTCA